MKRALSFAACVFVAGAVLVPTAAAADPSECLDWEFIGARGTGQAPTEDWDEDAAYAAAPFGGYGPEAADVWTTMRAVLDPTGERTGEPYPLHYPAANAIPPLTGNYDTSYEIGADDFVDFIEDLDDRGCAGTRVIAAGYSQGAQAIYSGLAQLDEDLRDYVSLVISFGDPQFDPTERGVNRGTFDPNLSGLHGKHLGWATHTDAPVLSYCTEGDVACNSRREATHTSDGWIDFGFVGGIAASRYGGDIFGAHQSYNNQEIGVTAARAGLYRLGYGTCAAPASTTDAGISGPKRAKAGQPITFAAVSVGPEGCSPAFGWSTRSASIGASRVLPAEESEPEPVTDEGPYFETTFDEPGLYEVEAIATAADGTQQTYVETVEVAPQDDQAPAAPLLSSARDSGDLTLSWEQPDPAADYYVVRDPSDSVVERLLPEADHVSGPRTRFEYEVANPDAGAYTVEAVNGAGTTQSVEVVTADAAVVRHSTLSAGLPVAGELTLSGDSGGSRFALGSSGSVSASGTYRSVLAADNGEQEVIAMDAADATIAVDGGSWEYSLSLDGLEDENGSLLSGRLREGFADSLLSGGYVTVRSGTRELALLIDAESESVQLNRWVVDLDAPQPTGVEGDEYYGSGNYVEVLHNGEYDPALMPAHDESAGGLDPNLADVSDVRTFVGDVEVTNYGWLSLYALGSPDSDATPNVHVAVGGIAGGDYQAMRDFLTDGAISFRVNGGAANVLTLRATDARAEELFPAPSVPRIYDTLLEVERGQSFSWWPSVDWGTDGWGQVEILAAEPPAGVTAESEYIWGEPLELGTFEFPVRATNATGTSEGVLRLRVVPPFGTLPADHASYTHPTTTAGVTSGNEFRFVGAGTPATEALDPTQIASGTYVARLATDAGSVMEVDMTAADATFEADGQGWALDLGLGTLTDVNGISVSQRTHDGFAEELLAGGSVEFEAGGQRYTVEIGASTDTEELNRFVLDPDANVPSGLGVDGFQGWINGGSGAYLTRAGNFSPTSVPFVEELAEVPAEDWPAAEVTDVRLYLGSSEIEVQGDLLVLGPDASGDAPYHFGLQYTGRIGNGHFTTLRAWLREGAISFRVNGGATNVVTLSATAAEAEAAVPTPGLPEFTSGSSYTVRKYDDVQWSPSVDWGFGNEGVVSWDTSQLPYTVFAQDGYLRGSMAQAGDFELRLTARNQGGTTVETVTIHVLPSVAHPTLYLSGPSVSRRPDGNLRIYFGWYGWVRDDNATLRQWLPAVHESGIARDVTGMDGAASCEPSELHFEDAQGAEYSITGSFEFRVSSNQGQSFIQLESTDAQIGDNSTAALVAFQSNAGTVEFRCWDGELNRFWRGSVANPTP